MKGLYKYLVRKENILQLQFQLQPQTPAAPKKTIHSPTILPPPSAPLSSPSRPSLTPCHDAHIPPEVPENRREKGKGEGGKDRTPIPSK